MKKLLYIKNMKKALILLFTLFFTVLTACTTSSSHNRGSLSAAMDKGRDGYEGEREVPDDEVSQDESSSNDDDAPHEEDDRDSFENSDELTPLEDSGPSSLQVLLRGGQSFLGGPYFIDSLDGEILVGNGSNHWAVYLTAGFNILKLNPEHDVYDSIRENPLALNAALEGRYYVFKDMKIFSPYLLGRIGGFILFWEFQNPLISGSETIRSDSLGGFILGAGGGIDLYRGDVFSIGAAVIPEWYLFGDQTSQGFTNDFFSSQGLVRWSLEGGFRF